MTPDNNLDEDILQCRAEILKALGQDAVDRHKKTDFPREDETAAKTAMAAPEQGAESVEVLIDETKPARSEENIEDWLLEDANSNSDSFENHSFLEEDLQEQKSPSKEMDPEPAHPSPQPAEKNNPQQSPAGSKASDYYDRVIKALTAQKDNLTATCKDQEKHIADLVSRSEQIHRQFREARQKISDLTSRVKRLSEFQQSAVQTKEELNKTAAEIRNLRRELTVLQQRHQETLNEKNHQTDSLLEKTALCNSLQSNLNRTTAELTEQTDKNQSLMQQINELQQQVRQLKTQVDQLQPLEQQRKIQDQDIHSLQEKIRDLQKTIDCLNQELGQSRSENDSLRQQVLSLEQTLSRQQTEARAALGSLREQLNRKEKEFESLQQSVVSSDLPPCQPQWDAEEVLVSQQISEHTDEGIPQFDLSDQILAPQRQQSSGRRLPPSHGRTTPTQNVRKVVQQFVTPSQEARDRDMPARQSFTKPPLRDTEYQPAARRSKDTRQPLIADIVRKDIENFCRQNQWLFIEFPSG